jgi:hypothetical protein
VGTTHIIVVDNNAFAEGTL